jgi:predicted SnoaL-like aldol condensation-catalyzing enzyme
MSVEENKVIDRRYIDEVLNKGNVAVIDEIMAPNYVGHVPGMPPSDRDGDKQLIGMFHAAFSDIHFAIEHQIAEGDKVVHHGTMHGRHTGEFMGIPPTGKEVTMSGININHFVDGKVVESWGMLDMLGLMQQLGVVPGGESTNT